MENQPRGSSKWKRGRFTYPTTPALSKEAEKHGNLGRMAALGKAALEGKTVEELRKKGLLLTPLPGLEGKEEE